MTEYFNPAHLIAEVKSRPGLYKTDHPADREEKLLLWKEVGAAIYNDWATFNKATAYDKVLQLQRKWRSLRDAYNRELRVRKAGSRRRRKVYKYFARMSFLGGFEGPLDEEDGNSSTAQDLAENQSASNTEENILPEDPPLSKIKKIRKKPRKRRSTADSVSPPEEMEMPVFPLEINDPDNDSDKLFMLSFLPEMRQLPSNIKMWVRAQIASVMQEAVTCHYTNSMPGSGDKNRMEVKRQRYDD